MVVYHLLKIQKCKYIVVIESADFFVVFFANFEIFFIFFDTHSAEIFFDAF